MGSQVDPLAVVDAAGALVDRQKAQLAGTSAAEDEGRRDHPQLRRSYARKQREEPERRRHDHQRTSLCQGQAQGGARQEDMHRPLRRRGQAQRLHRSRLKRLAQALEALFADALHLPQLLERAKAAVLRAVLDDALRQRRPDSIELVELLGRCGA